MSTTATTAPAEAALRDAPRRRFSVDDVMRMVEAGILTEDDHVELIDGELLVMTPEGPEHRTMKNDLRERLATAYGARFHLLDQDPIQTGDRSLPEPDLTVVRGRPRDYLERQVLAADTVLIVEVTKTSHRRDRAKVEVYARGGAPSYWLLDLDARCLEVHHDPDPETGRYRDVARLTEHEAVQLPELATSWSVASMLP